MAKAKKRLSKKTTVLRKSGFRLPDVRSLVLLAVLLIGIVISLLAVVQPTELRQKAGGCSLDNCNQCSVNGVWDLKNVTNCPAEPDGDQQLCAWAGRVGLCGGKTYCCPGAGSKWTTTMTACAGQVYEGPCVAPATPTPTKSPTSVPTKTPTPQPTDKPQATSTPNPTSTPRPTGTPRPTATRRPTSTPKPTVTPTPTKTPTVAEACGVSCVTDNDCKLGFVCVTTFATLRACRNRQCDTNPGCLCDDSSGGFFFATPTPGPGGIALRSLPLTIGGFTDGKGQTSQTPTISGVSEPDAKITITVYPDGIGGEVYADKTGKWTYKFTKKLTPGSKSILVVATKPDGQAQASKTFTVVGGGGGNPFGIILLIMILAAVAFGVYVYVKSNQ